MSSLARAPHVWRSPDPDKQPETDPNTVPGITPDPSGEDKPPGTGDGGSGKGGRPDVGTIPDNGVNIPSDDGGSGDAGPIT